MAKHVTITDKPIDSHTLIEDSKNNLAGALSIFIGTTKEIFNNKRVTRLIYEAHPTMAIKKLIQIADYCIEKYKLLGITIVHRIGQVVK